MVNPKNNNDLYIQLYNVSPPPRRDYYGLTVTAKHITLNTWRISHGPYIYPKVKKCNCQEYVLDYYLQCDVGVIFGKHVHQYILGQAKEQPNIQYLPSKIFLHILEMLSNNDILRLAETSKIIWELCNTNAAWEVIFTKRNLYPANKHEIKQAQATGWKSVLHSKIENKIIMLSRSMKNPILRPFDTGKIGQTQSLPDEKKIVHKQGTSIKKDSPSVWKLDQDEVVAYKNLTMPKSPFRMPSQRVNVRQVVSQSKSTSLLVDRQFNNSSVTSKSIVSLNQASNAADHKHILSKITK